MQRHKEFHALASKFAREVKEKSKNELYLWTTYTLQYQSCIYRFPQETHIVIDVAEIDYFGTMALISFPWFTEEAAVALWAKILTDSYLRQRNAKRILGSSVLSSLYSDALSSLSSDQSTEEEKVRFDKMVSMLKSFCVLHELSHAYWGVLPKNFEINLPISPAVGETYTGVKVDRPYIEAAIMSLASIDGISSFGFSESEEQARKRQLSDCLNDESKVIEETAMDLQAIAFLILNEFKSEKQSYDFSLAAEMYSLFSQAMFAKRMLGSYLNNRSSESQERASTNQIRDMLVHGILNGLDMNSQIANFFDFSSKLVSSLHKAFQVLDVCEPEEELEFDRSLLYTFQWCRAGTNLYTDAL